MGLSTPFESWPGDQAPQSRQVAIVSSELRDEAALWSAIAAFGDATGWICRPHELVEWPGSQASGPIVSAELARDDGKSLHIRQSEKGWTAWHLSEGLGESCMAFRQSYVGTLDGQPNRRLAYVVYWKLHEESEIEVYRPFAARFAGWENG